MNIDYKKFYDQQKKYYLSGKFNDLSSEFNDIDKYLFLLDGVEKDRNNVEEEKRKIETTLKEESETTLKILKQFIKYDWSDNITQFINNLIYHIKSEEAIQYPHEIGNNLFNIYKIEKDKQLQIFNQIEPPLNIHDHMIYLSTMLENNRAYIYYFLCLMIYNNAIEETKRKINELYELYSTTNHVQIEELNEKIKKYKRIIVNRIQKKLNQYKNEPSNEYNILI